MIWKDGYNAEQSALLGEDVYDYTGEVYGYMGHTGYSAKENVNNIDVVHLHWGLQLIFDESQKEGNNEIWIDLYALTRFLAKHTQAAEKVEETREWRRTNRIVDPAVEEYERRTSGRNENPGEGGFYGGGGSIGSADGYFGRSGSSAIVNKSIFRPLCRRKIGRKSIRHPA